ncbi:MAG TPA: hypothetical protein VFW11_10280 [Cyclobacteriaceae bacterium]|nr:hypothetical protein [Cyclobacteriaceae bacterium]
MIVAIQVLLLGTLQGQHAMSDSTGVDRSMAKAVALYNVSIRDQSLLYNGIEYKPYPEPYDGHPFFESEYVEEGSVLYDGELYEDIPLQYDLITDVLILEHYDQKGYVGMVSPHQHKIKSFRLLDHTFIRVAGDSTGGVLKDGFYDVLHKGTIMILVKRKKLVTEDVNFNQLMVSFPEKNNYYLVREGTYFPVKGKAGMVRVLRDKKRLLNQFVSKNRLDFQNNKEKSMAALAAYYEQIQH